MTRRKVFIANWKMNKTINDALSFVKGLTTKSYDSDILIAAPYTIIAKAADAARGSKIEIGAQNMHDELEGAYTGEISAGMLLDAGAKFVLIGHSERRIHFQESNEFINKKLKRALEVGLKPVLCIGETLDERENSDTDEVLKTQLEECLSEIDDLSKIILAYEPVWAIGTGVVATIDQASTVHAFCRNWVSEHRSKQAAERLAILYGGSVKPDNIKALMAVADIDGALVGGASLKLETFTQIIT